jgi:ribosomal protein L27
MDFTDLVQLAGVEQDAFRQRGFPGVNVGHDADVAIFVKVFCL